LKVKFKRKYHAGRWYEEGEVADLMYRLAVRLLNRKVVELKPKRTYKKKEKSSASEAEKGQKPPSPKIQKGSDSADTGQYSEEVDIKKYSGTSD